MHRSCAHARNCNKQAGRQISKKQASSQERKKERNKQANELMSERTNDDRQEKAQRQPADALQSTHTIKVLIEKAIDQLTIKRQAICG